LDEDEAFWVADFNRVKRSFEAWKKILGILGLIMQ
jgi:hypothetical protein